MPETYCCFKRFRKISTLPDSKVLIDLWRQIWEQRHINAVECSAFGTANGTEISRLLFLNPRDHRAAQTQSILYTCASRSQLQIVFPSGLKFCNRFWCLIFMLHDSPISPSFILPHFYSNICGTVQTIKLRIIQYFRKINCAKIFSSTPRIQEPPFKIFL